MSPELETIHQIRAAIELNQRNSPQLATALLMKLIDRLLDEHFVRLGVTDEEMRGLDELANSGPPC